MTWQSFTAIVLLDWVSAKLSVPFFLNGATSFTTEEEVHSYSRWEAILGKHKAVKRSRTNLCLLPSTLPTLTTTASVGDKLPGSLLVKSLREHHIISPIRKHYTPSILEGFHCELANSRSLAAWRVPRPSVPLRWTSLQCSGGPCSDDRVSKHSRSPVVTPTPPKPLPSAFHLDSRACGHHPYHS